ncbi:MAG: hypothetical protein H8E48_14845 [Chloroflexi bacterium]|nr:hypothetical protein [Chloroflexota bacterium]
MATYEQKLTEFAQGKRFLRLSRPIRVRADALCDACGSTRPRTLYALEDQASKRHFFVGDTCSKELVKLGAIFRYGRKSGQAQFENEMRLRSAELESDQSFLTSVESTLNPAGREDSPRTSTPEPASQPIYPAIFVIETTYDYQAFAYGFPSVGGGTYAWGYAREERYQKLWTPGGERGLVLEEKAVEQPDAIVQCINKAWEEACSGRKLGRLTQDSRVEPDWGEDNRGYPNAFAQLPFVDSLAQMVAALAGKFPESRPVDIDPDRSSDKS